ncbi:hypothetical protein, partial [Sinorhizobium meliloti]|uniref:hypothetical protein n=1 Tax=Rhizobium meliloti TaxID=382 RepID=UPI001AECAFE5
MAVLDYGPEKADLGMCKVSVLLVVERRRRIEEGRLYVSAVSAPLDRLYFEACCVCEKVSRTIWRFAWQ